MRSNDDHPWRRDEFRDRRAKLTPQDRDAIRARLAKGETLQVLAAEYGVSTSTIRKA